MGLIERLIFQLWYFRKPPWDTGISPPELMEFIHSHPPGAALDLGCGTGTNVITLAQNGWKVTGIDFASRAIRIAREKAKQAGVAPVLKVGDVTDLREIDGPFDLILDIGCFHSLRKPDRQLYIQNIERLLVEKGAYLLYAFFKQAEAEAGPGITPADLDDLAGRLELISRQDGSERGWRPSAWFIYQKRNPSDRRLPGETPPGSDKGEDL